MSRVIEAPPATGPQPPAQLAADAGAYWTRSGSNEWIRDMSHWRGRGRWSDDATWSDIGAAHFAMFQRLCPFAGRKRPVRRMVEWGPGGGANAVAFTDEVTEFYGVDISAPNLDECGRQLTSRGFAGWRPVLLDPARPADAVEAIGAPVDFFLSTAVFQHFPGQAYGVEVLGIAARLLGPEGLALIQIRYDDGSQVLRSKDSDYAKNAVTFTSYRTEDFWDHAQNAGLDPLAVVLKPQDRYAYFWLRKG